MRFIVFAFLVVLLGADFAVPPVPTHFVTDNAGALSSGAADAIDSRLRDYQKATGHQVIVYIDQTTGDVPLETWTGETAHQWKVGRKGHDDGAILFLFMRDHKVRIEVGYGLEGSLADADASRIIRDTIVPKMRSGDVDGAVSGGVAAMLTKITPDYKGVTPPPEASNDTGSSVAMGAVVLALVIFFIVTCIMIAVLLAARRGKKGGHVISSSGSSSGGFWSGLMSSSGGGSDDFSSGGDFDSGGGDFGGGGASGSW